MRLQYAALLLFTVTLTGPEPLRVRRQTPAGDATPASDITVTFDRPVAGALDRSVDLRSVFAIEPAVQGSLEWRDPVTIRFVPAASR